MNIPWVKGRVALQAHVGVPDGTCEEEFARGGFFGRYAHLYRSRPPVEWTRIEGELKPRAYKVLSDEKQTAGRWPVLENAYVRILLDDVSETPSYWSRNADADELLFVHRGAGVLETDFGPITYRRGDYLVVPRGTVTRLIPVERTQLLICESFSELRFPDKGMLGQHALFDPAVLRVPEPPHHPLPESKPGSEYELRVQRMGRITSVFYPTVPITTVGWKGTLAAFALNVDDIRPVSSDRYHLPPSAHTTFVADGFVVCSFLPRPLENGDPRAMKVPFYHSNIDYDEVLFYHAGQFFSRTGIGPGMMTFHPQGIHHGPQPGAAERTANVTHTDEVAVMIDTQRPLMPSTRAATVEWLDYSNTWRKK